MKTKTDSTINLRHLPGTDGSNVKAVRIRSVTHASKFLRKGNAVTAAGDDGAINIWKGDDGQWWCMAMRFTATLDSVQFKHLAAVVEWLKMWLPRIRRERNGES